MTISFILKEPAGAGYEDSLFMKSGKIVTGHTPLSTAPPAHRPRSKSSAVAWLPYSAPVAPMCSSFKFHGRWVMGFTLAQSGTSKVCHLEVLSGTGYHSREVSRLNDVLRCRTRKERCINRTLKRVTLLAAALSVAPAAYFLVPLLTAKASKSQYTCNNRNYRNLTATIREFNARLAEKLRENDSGQETVYEDDDQWVQVLPRTYVYYAYMDDSEPQNCHVRIVSVVPRDSAQEMAVQCWLNVGPAVFLSEANLEVLPEHHGLPYAAAFFLCPVKFPSEVRNHPNMRVALGTNWNMTSPQWLRVRNQRKRPLKFCSVCVRPVVEHYRRFSSITEFIAYYASMGVAHFNIYLCQVPREVEVLLSHLRESGKVDIRLHRWNLPLNDSSVLAYGQMAAIQDCIYRSRLASEYIINVDFDEFIVSKTRNRLTDAILEIETSVGKNSLGSVLVKNQFFCYEYPLNAACLRHKPPMLSRILFLREANVWKHYERSKYVARTTAVVSGGVHFVWEHAKGARTVAISESVMVMHHYRSCCGVRKSNFWRTSYWEFLGEEHVVVDKFMYAISARLVYSNVVASVKELMDELSTEPLFYSD
ncbi:uncharacterized protein LOC119169323 [Rhipicephalus microplus]|uniref:uncharacterized protein LOC119169323 n=1 Tax=Rhipicephalus microplus TaxID=6941 RepID=UPI003F6C72ED